MAESQIGQNLNTQLSTATSAPIFYSKNLTVMLEPFTGTL